MISLIHNKVPGRVRYEVAPLFNAPDLKQDLENRLGEDPHILHAKVNPITASILVQYDPDDFNSQDDFKNRENDEGKGLNGSVVSHIAGVILTELENRITDSNPPDTRFGSDSRVLFPPPTQIRKGGGRKKKKARSTESTENEATSSLHHPDSHWHRMDNAAVLTTLETDDKSGLHPDTVDERFRAIGPNLLDGVPLRSQWEILSDQFKSLPVALLGAAAGLSIFTGGMIDAGVILGVVAANALIGWKMEKEAELALSLLKKETTGTTGVIRNGRLMEVETDTLVPGDVVLLKQGDYVPADCRILEADRLTIDESMLTGESLVVDKIAAPLTAEALPLADRRNMAYMGTSVVGGKGVGVVVVTGRRTEVGRLRLLLGENGSPEPPIKRELADIGNKLVLLFMGVCTTLLGIGVLKKYAVIPSIRTVVSLAGSAVPEGLPTVVTLSFALGVRNMKSRQVTVRRLDAVETLGAAQAVCLDKTGTITCNRMTVVKALTCSSSVEFEKQACRIINGRPGACGDDPEVRTLLEMSVLCNETVFETNRTNQGGTNPIDEPTSAAPSSVNPSHGNAIPIEEVPLKGSPTENALVRIAMGAGIDVQDLRQQHPLTEIHHRVGKDLFMSSVHKVEGDETLIALKGSPMQLLEMCELYLLGEKPTPLTPEMRIKIQQQNDEMTDEGLRVLGVAYKRISNKASGLKTAPENKSSAEIDPKMDVDAAVNADDGMEAGAAIKPDDAVEAAVESKRQSVSDWKNNGIFEELIWVGLIGMDDPIRDGVREMISRLHRAGIDTIMITGDQPRTARIVAEKLHLNRTGPLKVLDYSELKKSNGDNVEFAHVYARVTYAQKLKIVKSLQNAGKVVVMTGDGINDGPALKAADVGIAMGGSGTEFARDAADIVLEQDNLNTLVTAIGDGRTIHENIKKSVHYFVSSNFSEIIVMSVAMAAGMGFPLNVMQLLWINLVTDIFPGVALSLEAPETDAMKAPPRDANAPLFSSSDYKQMAKESSIISAGTLAAYGTGLIRYGAGTKSNSLAFHTLMVSQLLHVLTSRSQRRSQFDREKRPENKWLTRGIAGSLLLQGLTMALPGLRRFLDVTRPSPLDLVTILGSALLSFTLNEKLKPTPSEIRYEISNPTSNRPENPDQHSGLDQ